MRVQSTGIMKNEGNFLNNCHKLAISHFELLLNDSHKLQGGNHGLRDFISHVLDFYLEMALRN